MKHTRDNLQAVLDPVVDFPEQDLMTIKGGLKLTLILLLLDRHSENVCSALEEGDVILTEFSLGATVDLQHARNTPAPAATDLAPGAGGSIMRAIKDPGDPTPLLSAHAALVQLSLTNRP